MKSEMGMDAPDTHVSHRRYENFAEFAADVEVLVDLLWECASREFMLGYVHFMLYYIYVLVLVYANQLPSLNPNRKSNNAGGNHRNSPTDTPIRRSIRINPPA
jgi:hypothetical protein